MQIERPSVLVQLKHSPWMNRPLLRRQSKRNSIALYESSVLPVNLIPLIVQWETSPRGVLHVRTPAEDYQTAKRCSVVTNNKQISSSHGKSPPRARMRTVQARSHQTVN